MENRRVKLNDILDDNQKIYESFKELLLYNNGNVKISLVETSLKHEVDFDRTANLVSFFIKKEKNIRPQIHESLALLT